MKRASSCDSPAARKFGASVRKLRERKGWSLETFAKRLGMTPRRVEAIEAGRGQVTLTDIVNIGRKLDRPAGIVVRPLNPRKKKGRKRERRT
jgi:transcriptional regulator with XRE-family HTH domain